jgi:Asp/Glu/hydantoin racemase
MKLLLVNPNITEAVTRGMLAEARRSASPDVELASVTARFGTRYVENRAEAAIAAHAVLEAVADTQEECDGILLGAFGDPGLDALRELFDVPVTGIQESALLTARMLGRRTVIVCMTPRLGTWYEENARAQGLDEGLVGVRALDVPVTDIARAPELLREPLLARCLQAVDADRAETIILGGGPLAGLARELAGQVPVPLLDGVSCAVMMLEALVRLAPGTPRSGSYARPAPKPSRGLSPRLARRISGDGDAS